MGDNLLESYNPLYDVHLRQYFALPHMQKHLRNLGLLDGSAGQSEELHAGHLQMMDMMLRNRERVLQQLVDLQRKLDAAEKVELYRRIRSGVTNAEELERSHVSRSLSRPARSALGNGRFSREGGGGHRRQQSHSPEAGDLIKRVETDYRADSAPIKNSKSIYNRLAANAYKYQYLHKLDDRTLRKYMNSLRKQLAKLERFREVSFGPHTMAKHQPAQLQQSWFFRRRSLKSGRKSRSGKSQSPRRATTGATADEPLTKMRRTSMSRTRASQKLPPLPQVAKRSFTGNRSMPTPSKSMEQKLPPTGVAKQAKKTQERPTRRPQPTTVHKTPGIKGTPIGARPPSKGSTTPVKVQKPPSMSGALPVIGVAAAVGAGVAAVAATVGDDDERKEEENRENVAPSPSISLAASQTTTTDGQPAGDSEWEGDQGEAPAEVAHEEEARPTPGPFEGEAGVTENHMEDSEGQLTARTEVKSAVKEELMEGQDETMEEKENEVNIKSEEEIKREVESPVGREEAGYGMEEDESKIVSSSPGREEFEESKEIPQETTQACSLQQHYERVKREAAMKEEEREEEVFEHPQKEEEEEKYEDKENERIISPKEEIISQHSPENLMNGGHYGHNEEPEGSERSVEIKEENLKEEEDMLDEDKRVSDSRVSFAKSEDSFEKRDEYPSERQKSEEALVEMEEMSNQQVEEEENIQESPVKVTITPSPENKSWEEEEGVKEENVQKEDEEEEKVVVMAESPVDDRTSISYHSEAERDEEAELQLSPRVEEELGQSEAPLDSACSAVNGIHYGEGQETQSEQHEAERDLEHRYELPESKTVSDYVEETSEQFNENKDGEVFEEGHRMKRDVDGFDGGQEVYIGKEEHFGEVHTGRDGEHGRGENGFGGESQLTGREEDEHIGREEVQFTGRDVHTGREEHGVGDEEHVRDIEGFGREDELHTGRDEQYIERERMTGRDDAGTTEGEEEGFGKGNHGREEEHTGREENLRDSEEMSGRDEEHGAEDEHTEVHSGRGEDNELRERESQHTGRETVEFIKEPDETEFEQLVESESVQPVNEDTSRKLSGSDKFIQLESSDRDSIHEERPETIMSLGNNSQVMPDQEPILRGTSELDNYSKGEEKEEEIDEANLVHSEESEYNRPESKDEDVSEAKHEDILEYEPGNRHEDNSDFGHEDVNENRSEVQHEEMSESRQEEPEVTSRKSEDISEFGHENISEVRHEDVQEEMPEGRPESHQEVNERNIEDRPELSPEVISEVRPEEINEVRPIGEYTTDQDEYFGKPNLTPREGTEYEINEGEKQHIEDHENDPETFRSEHSENQILIGKEEELIHHSESPNLSASIYEGDTRSNHSKSFLQQPSIEITPASDLSEYVETRGDDEQKSEHSQPMSPVGEESEQQQHIEWRHYEQQDIHQEENHKTDDNYQEQLIDFSSSPTAQGEIIDISHQTQHSPHQNGHLKNYEDHENEDDENTSLLTYRDENGGSPSKKSNNYKGENGHLLMGNGENSGRLSSSSTETEGADNNSDDSSVVIRQGTSTSLEHGQQQFQKLENEGRIEEL